MKKQSASSLIKSMAENDGTVKRGGQSDDRVLLLGPASVLLLLIAIVSLNPLELASQWRNLGFDWLRAMAGSEAPMEGSPVTLIEIDASSLERLGDWPWPRTRYAELVAEAEVAGARAILVDDPLNRADPTSPAVVTRHLEAYAAPTVDPAALPVTSEHDAALADTLSFSRAVIPVLVRRPGDYPGTATVDATRTDGLEWASSGALSIPEDTRSFFLPLTVADTPLETYTAIGVTFGIDGALPDPDGVLRSLPLAARVGSLVVGSDVLETVRLSDGRDAFAADATGAPDRFSLLERNGLQSLTVNDRTVPVTADGRMLFHPRKHGDLARLPAWRVLQDPSIRSILSDRVVVIAPTAEGTMTPMVAASGLALSPGEAKALALDQIFSGRSLARPDWASTLEDTLLIVLGLGLLGLVVVGRSVYAVAGSLLAIPLVGLGSWYAFTGHGILFDAVVPSIGFALLAVSIAWVALAQRASRRRRLFIALESKLPASTALTLSSQEGQRHLAGEVRKITVLYCDLRHADAFTGVHRNDPAWMTHQIQRFHSFISERIAANGGVADVRHGTGVMGFWNAPKEDPHHAKAACDCVLKILDGLEAFNIALEAEGAGRTFVTLNISAGLTTGHALVGNLGTDTQIDYTAHGEPVTMARLLQRYAEIYGTPVVLGEPTYHAVRHRYALLEVDRLGLDGRDASIRTYALLGNPVLRANPHFKTLQQVHSEIWDAYCAQNWQAVRTLIARAREMRGSIAPLYDFYEQRLRFLEANPPEAPWDGSFRAPVH
ncbi:MAG: CHASE2 domain-containing protein [Alphaproteobacteria bacterium]